VAISFKMKRRLFEGALSDCTPVNATLPGPRTIRVDVATSLAEGTAPTNPRRRALLAI
jgi:hypothetical protein